MRKYGTMIGIKLHIDLALLNLDLEGRGCLEMTIDQRAIFGDKNVKVF